MNAKPWTPQSWQERPLSHLPPYPDHAALETVLAKLRTLPPLVFPGEVDRLSHELAEAEDRRRFWLQGGDCAERFIDCHEESIGDKFKILLQMSVVLTYHLRKPIIKVGRLAGQYAKPRSQLMEDSPQGPVFSYAGDNINDYGPEPQGRIPEPRRLLDAYFHGAATANYLRALLAGGFADLHHPGTWDLDALHTSEHRKQYEATVERILSAIDFMESFGGGQKEVLGSTDFWLSHEGLHLPFEAALTRKRGDAWYALSAHFLWIGERTRALEGAHVEYFRGISNPLGVKLGPGATPADLMGLAAALNPLNRKGRMVWVTRMGSEGSRQNLENLLACARDEGLAGLWVCDPMHGNTEKTASGIKTRRFDRILAEIDRVAEAHQKVGTYFGGVHFELTGDHVTECLGGPANLQEADLGTRYETWCDPRLNYAQSLEMAFRISTLLGS